jgi:acyl carrier protein
MENVIAILKSIRPECDFAAVDDFFARGMLDSFDLTMLVSALEERFSISMDGSDILPENFRSVQAILLLLARYGVANGVSS